MWSIERQFLLEDGLQLWEQASGITIDRQAPAWWRLFATVKACTIWATAEASFTAGRARDMALAMSAVRGIHFHRTHLLTLMADRGAMG